MFRFTIIWEKLIVIIWANPLQARESASAWPQSPLLCAARMRRNGVWEVEQRLLRALAGRGRRMHNSLRFGRLRCNHPRCSHRCKIATDAPLLWRTMLEQPEVEQFLPICRRRWRHAHDLRDFTFGSEQSCHDGAWGEPPSYFSDFRAVEHPLPAPESCFHPIDHTSIGI